MMKGRIRIVFQLLLLCMFISCSTVVKKGDQSYVNLDGVILQTDSLLLGHKVVAIVDNHLVVPTWKNDFLYDIYQIKDDSLLLKKRLIPRGQGPDALTSSQESYDVFSGRFVIYDCNIGKGFQIDASTVDELLASDDWENLKGFNNEIYISQMIYETDSTLLTSFMRDGFESFLGRLNFNTGEYTVLYGLWPDDSFEGSNFVKQTVYANGTLLKCPNRNLYLLSSSVGQYAEVFSIERDSIVPRFMLYGQYPRYQMSEDNLNVRNSKDNMRGMDISVTSDFIYVMLEKGTIEEYVKNIDRMNSYNYTDEVFVYGWDGALKSQLKLDRDILTLFVDEDNRFLYGKTVDDETEEEYMVRFELPDTLLEH